MHTGLKQWLKSRAGQQTSWLLQVMRMFVRKTGKHDGMQFNSTAYQRSSQATSSVFWGSIEYDFQAPRDAAKSSPMQHSTISSKIRELEMHSY